MDAGSASDDAIVRTLATGAAPGAVIEQAAVAIRAMCPDRGVAVWHRRPNGAAAVQAAGVRPHLTMISGEAESSFWERAHTVFQPNYNITFTAHPDDRHPTSVWCIPCTDGPVAGDLVVVLVGPHDGPEPTRSVQARVEHITRLIAVSLDRHRLLERLEDGLDRADADTPMVATGLAPTRGDTEEPAETALIYVGLAELDDVESLHGHHAVEELAEQVLDRLSRTVRPGDTVARLNRTDFALRCYRTSTIQAESIAARVLNDLWAPMTGLGETTRLRPRIGLARGATPTPLSSLLHDADLAMHNANRLGHDWMWAHDAERPAATDAVLEVGRGFGAGPAALPDQSEPGRLADSAPGSPE
jgi:GGDEF domain-containing protein